MRKTFSIITKIERKKNGILKAVLIKKLYKL